MDVQKIKNAGTKIFKEGTKEEKIKFMSNLKKSMQKTKQKIDYENAMQLALKLVINGAYGAFANKWFCFFNNDLAASITSTCRDLTQLMDKKNAEYWYDLWHKDHRLHEHLGLEKGSVKPIPKDKAVSVYGDTDSIFVGFGPGMESCNWEEDGKDPMEFINKVHEFRLIKYFIRELDNFAKKHGVDNIEDFELEKIAESVLFIEKKNYMQNIIMEDGISFDSLSYFQAKGIETVRSSTPPFAREKVMEAIKYLFKNPDTYNIKEMLKIVQDLKKEFEYAKIEDISMMTSMNKYNEKVINDGREETPFEYERAISKLDLNYEDFSKGGHKKGDGASLYVPDTLEIVKGAHFSVKAAAAHNYLLSKDEEHRLKYDFIKSGTKVKYYYTKDPKYPVFAYVPGEYPIEIAPEIDYNLQFEKSMLSIINRFVKVLGMPEINKRVSVIMPLFSKI
jgi:hypothetical protein